MQHICSTSIINNMLYLKSIRDCNYLGCTTFSTHQGYMPYVGLYNISSKSKTYINKVFTCLTTDIRVLKTPSPTKSALMKIKHGTCKIGKRIRKINLGDNMKLIKNSRIIIEKQYTFRIHESILSELLTEDT